MVVRKDIFAIVVNQILFFILLWDMACVWKELKQTNLTVLCRVFLDPREGWRSGKRRQWWKSKDWQCRWTSGLWSHWHHPVNKLLKHGARALEATFPPKHLEDQHSYLTWPFVLFNTLAFYLLTSQSRWAMLYLVCSSQQLYVVFMSVDQVWSQRIGNAQVISWCINKWWFIWMLCNYLVSL